jgi:hypothetical protein
MTMHVGPNLPGVIRVDPPRASRTAVAGSLLALFGSKDDEPKRPASTVRSSAERPSLQLKVAALRGFAGESHAVVGLPGGDCIAALSWFSDTGLGSGPLTTADGKRQGVLVRYRPDASVVWTQAIGVWPADLAFDGESRVLVVGQPMDDATAFATVEIAEGTVKRRGFIDGYAKAGAFTDDGRMLVLSTGKGSTGVHVDDVTEGTQRLPWSHTSNLANDIGAAPDGGAYVTLSHGVGADVSHAADDARRRTRLRA